jgi:hypothetical protein
VFTVLVVAPLGVVIWKWDIFSGAIGHLASGGTFSLSSVAAVTIPALLYAWLLKNVSRMFIHNLNLADDAAHRKSLAITYLGLSANPKLSISDADRALVLNALFRPTPSQSLDEGPPSGLLELIRK